MIASIAKNRIEQVAKADTINASQGDFLATHVPIKKLQVIKQFETVPMQSKLYSEEEVFQEYIINPENRHQFIAVYGQSGTGKSHLIRWLATRFDQSKPDNEVSLFIRRKDRSLKGTIRQLLNAPEVQNLQNKEVYERLVKATEVVEENKLKSMIYYFFLVEVDSNADENKGGQLTKLNRKRLSAFLADDLVKSRMMQPDGPVDRVYSKIAEHSHLLDRDVNAEFLPEDFTVDADFFESMQDSGASQNAIKLATQLMSESEGAEQQKKYADYMNLFVPTVVQQCAGIQPNDFEDVFLEIRKGLHTLGKNLTIFIEDVTSFTGVDEALLNALMVEHTGLNAGEKLCRISSIVGSTIDYLRNNFRDNHKDRITQYIYIPDALFEGEDIYEFFGRYLNAMSMEEPEISRWLSNGAKSDAYPVHIPVEGKVWDSIEVGGDSISLFPFTKRSIDYFYQYELKQGQKTPRYILQQIIEPTVRDYLFNTEHFPSRNYVIMTGNPQLSFAIKNQVDSTEEQDRLLRFLCIWGNGKPTQYTDGKDSYISGVKKEMLEEVGLPVVKLGESIPTPEPEPTPKPERPPVVENEKLNKAYEVLSKWVAGEGISIGSLSGIEGVITKGRDDLCAMLFSAINWQSADISIDNIEKVKSSSSKLVELERQSQGTGMWTLKANQESSNVLSVMLRWRVLGNQSWNYAGSDFDVYLISKWLKAVKPELISVVRCKYEYVQPAICVEIIREILNGEYTESDLMNYSSSYLFLKKQPKRNESRHSASWNALLSSLMASGKDDDNRKTIRNSFNIAQGTGGRFTVLNSIKLEECMSKLKEQKLMISENQLPMNDGIKQRKDCALLYLDIFKRIKKVAEDEVEQAKKTADKLKAAFGVEALSDIEEGDVDNFMNLSKTFYKTANQNMVDIKAFDINKNAVDEAKVLSATKKLDAGIKAENNELKVIQTFSSDPLLTVEPLLKLFERLEKDFEKTDKVLEIRRRKLADQGVVLGSNDYQNQLTEIASISAKIGGLSV